MPIVLLDNDPVSFSGPFPENMDSLIAFIDQYLHTTKRFRSSISIDGKVLSPDNALRYQLNFNSTISIDSCDFSFYMTTNSSCFLELISSISIDMNSLYKLILFHSWSDKSVEIVNLITSYVGVFSFLNDLMNYLKSNEMEFYADIKMLYFKSRNIVSEITECIKRNDIGLLAEIIKESFLPTLKNVKKILLKIRESVSC